MGQSRDVPGALVVEVQLINESSEGVVFISTGTQVENAPSTRKDLSAKDNKRIWIFHFFDVTNDNR